MRKAGNAPPLPRRFLEGLRLFQAGAFWEAHEAWEDLWREAREPERTLLKALIQIAAACIHARKGHWRGVQGLLGRVARYLARVPDGTLNLEIPRLRRQVHQALAFARQAEQDQAPGRPLHIALPVKTLAPGTVDNTPGAAHNT